jgi:hypothetical protein
MLNQKPEARWRFNQIPTRFRPRARRRGTARLPSAAGSIPRTATAPRRAVLRTRFPAIAPAARAKFVEYSDLLWAFSFDDMGYQEFAGRALRRSRGEDEDGPYKKLMEENNMTMEEVLRNFFDKE